MKEGFADFFFNLSRNRDAQVVKAAVRSLSAGGTLEAFFALDPARQCERARVTGSDA